MIANWKSALNKAWANRLEHDGSTWHDDCRILQERIRQINDKVLLRPVPICMVKMHKMGLTNLGFHSA